MKIQQKTPQAVKLQELFMSVLHRNGYRFLSHFCQRYGYHYRKTYQQIYYGKWINLDLVNSFLSKVEPNTKIILSGDEIMLEISK